MSRILMVGVLLALAVACQSPAPVGHAEDHARGGNPHVGIERKHRPISGLIWWQVEESRCYVSLELRPNDKTGFVDVPNDWCKDLQ